jgi:hypothetical protein
MRKLIEIVKNPSGLDSLSNYMGEVPEADWLCVMTRSRDSDCLTESNWRVALRMLGGESDNVRIDRFGHWACGWWESLSVKDGSSSHSIGQDITEQIDSYPILDEDDFSEIEQEQANEVWESFNDKERVEYIRDNRSQFEFRSLGDLLSCARGKYFCGYASELLS